MYNVMLMLNVMRLYGIIITHFKSHLKVIFLVSLHSEKLCKKVCPLSKSTVSGLNNFGVVPGIEQCIFYVAVILYPMFVHRGEQK